MTPKYMRIRIGVSMSEGECIQMYIHTHRNKLRVYT